MFVKKFEASTFEGAIKRVKSEMGPNALILSTTTKKANWFSKPIVEITAAFEKKEKTIIEAPKEDRYDEKKMNEIFPHRLFKSEKLYIDELDEVKPIDKMERRVLKGTRKDDVVFKVDSYEKTFLDLGFLPETAAQFSKKMTTDYSKGDVKSDAFLEKVKSKILLPYLQCLSFSDICEKTSWAPIGLAGSGKTTFLVKLALSMSKMKKDSQVRLASIDNKKVIAKQEMTAYSKLINVPFIHDLNKTKGETLLIDCPAFLSHQKSDLELEEGTRGKNTFLLLDGTMRFNEMIKFYEKASHFSFRAVAFTKMDQVGQRGALFDFIKETRLPLFGLSTSGSFKEPLKFFNQEELSHFLSQKIQKGKGSE